MTTTPPTRREALARERAAAEAPTTPSRGRRAATCRLSAVGLALALARSLVSTGPVTGQARTAARRRPTARRPSSSHPSATRTAVACAMLFVGATIVSTSVPANAYFVDTPAESAVKLALASGVGLTKSFDGDGQVIVTTDDLRPETLGRDGYSVSIAAIAGATVSPVGDPSAAIRWPFPTSVPISSGFGSRRVADCSFCSTNHQGLDFTPGAGTPIQAVAAGTVSRVEQGGGALGYSVWIDHVIDGVATTTVSAHMTAGSIKVVKGQTVTSGTVIGLVGSTGNSTGPHLHFEVHVSGAAVDPFPWLVTHAGAVG